jgi:hypothetical protein
VGARVDKVAAVALGSTLGTAVSVAAGVAGGFPQLASTIIRMRIATVPNKVFFIIDFPLPLS